MAYRMPPYSSCVVSERSNDTINIQISLTDGNRFDCLQGKAQNIVLALKNLNSRAAQEAENEEEV